MGRYNGGLNTGPGKSISLKIQRAYTSSGSFVAPASGIVKTMQMGGGGGGGKSGASGTATGGSSAAWAGKIWKVEKGQTLTIVIGAGGTYGASDGAPGGDGGATTISNGVTTVTSPGGKGGLASAAAAALTGPAGGAAPTNADIGAAGSKSGNCAAIAGARTGGAGVDLLAKGGNATRSGNATQGLGTGGGSVAWHSDDTVFGASFGAGYGGPSDSGLGVAGADIYGTQLSMPISLPSEWGIPHFGRGGAPQGEPGQPGGGGASGADQQGSRTGDGGFGGGGGAAGSSNPVAGGRGGYGAGGGAGNGAIANAGRGDSSGGQGYVWLEFVPNEVV